MIDIATVADIAVIVVIAGTDATVVIAVIIITGATVVVVGTDAPAIAFNKTRTPLW